MLSSSENGTYRTCCTNGPELYTHPQDSPVISVYMAAKYKIVHDVCEAQNYQ